MPQAKDAGLTPPPPEAVAVVEAGQPVTAGPTAGADDPPPASPGTPTGKMSKPEIFWMLLAYFGSSLAYLVPFAYSISLRVNELTPGREEILGYLMGTAQVIYLIASPLLGLWSDRTRSRLGRRRPFMAWGLALGTLSLVGMAMAPNILLVGAAWVLAMLGLCTVQAAIFTLQADRLPEEQRGKVSGLTGLVGQVAPVIGVTAIVPFSSNTLLVFLIPATLGAVLVVPYLIRAKDADSRSLARSTERVSVREVAASYVFNPRENPDFAWNWIGRFVFFLGLYANTTYSTFFYAQRLDIPVNEVAGTVAALGLIGILCAVVGGLGGGFLSDRFRRRKLFTMIGALLFGCGAVVEAFAYSLPALLAGSLLMSLAIAAFTAVDQAIVISVLPDRAQAGRYMAVVAFAQKIPSGLMPFVSSLIVGIGATGAEKNYTLLYLMGGALALIGGSIILTRVKSVR